MSQENVEVVRQIYGHLALGDFWAIAPLLDPEISWDWGDEMRLVEGSQVYDGREGVEAATREWLKSWERAWIEAEEFLDAGDRVVAFVHIRARPKHGGPEVSMHSANVWTVHNGMATSMKGYTRDAALKAVGLAE
jgi:ketosteroid isomerase-like protein